MYDLAQQSTSGMALGRSVLDAGKAPEDSLASISPRVLSKIDDAAHLTLNLARSFGLIREEELAKAQQANANEPKGYPSNLLSTLQAAETKLTAIVMGLEQLNRHVNG